MNNATFAAIRLRHHLLPVAVMLVLLLLFLAPAGVAHGAAITVTTTLDDNSVNGTCTLREAIIAANTNATVDACTAGSNIGTDIITLTAGGIYSLVIPGSDEDAAASGDLDITNNAAGTDLILNVAGGSATISQDASPDDRVLHLHGVSVEITGIAITGGSTDDNGQLDADGGGIFIEQDSTLTLIAAAVSANAAHMGGGIYNDMGTLTLDASTLSGNISSYNGGGLYSRSGQGVTIQNASLISGNSSTTGVGGGVQINAGTAAVSGSTISNNTAPAGYGGGIVNGGILTVTASTIASNTAISGGGLYNGQYSSLTVDSTLISGNIATDHGGGVYNLGNLTIRNASTLTLNSAATAGGRGGAVYNFAGTATIQGSSTITQNTAIEGGGLFNGSTMTVRSSTISANSAVSGGGVMNQAGTLTVDDTLITGNTVSWDGGAIFNRGGEIDVTDSRLLANSAEGYGGAVYNNVIDAYAMEMTESCIVGNSDVAVTTDSSTPQIAANNWWGAPDGPSGTASGFGDSVSANILVLGWKTAPILECDYVPGATQHILNRGFENDSNNNGIPNKWSTSGLKIPPDGRVCNSTNCWMLLKGTGANKTIKQTVTLAGSAGDGFTFSTRSFATNVPTSGGVYRAQVKITYTDGTSETFQVNFSAGSHGWETLVAHFVADKAYTKLAVTLRYSRSSGQVRFDSVNLWRFP